MYTTPASKDLERAAMEEFFVLGFGYLQYATNKAANERDWSVGTTWDSFEHKLTFQYASFDDNHFDTNWLTHPGSGWLYYTAARSNRLGILTSVGYSFATSTIWEIFGEMRERTSWNDVIATPTAGVPIGESMLQVGALFHRSRPNVLTTGGGWLFAPFKSVHDLMDGLEPARAARVDDLGVADDVWHRFAVGASMGANAQAGSPKTEIDARGWLSTEVVTLPGYRRAGKRSGTFDSGEVSAMRVQWAGASGRFVDFGITSNMLPAGWYWQDVAVDPKGNLRGAGFLTGLNLGVEYTRHDYDRDRRRNDDRIALVSVGATAEHIAHAGGLTVRARLDVLGHFGGVMAYGLDEYERRRGDAGLTSVLGKERYYHSLGGTVRPTLELAYGPFDAGTSLQFDAFRAIEGTDVEFHPKNEVSASDRRVQAKAWAGLSPARHVRIFLAGERNLRSGWVGGEHASRTEAGVYLGGEVVF